MKPHHSVTNAKQQNVATAAFLLIFALLGLYFIGLDRTGLFDVDEAIFAQASAEMLETGDFVTPHYNAEPRYHKPPLIYWAQAGVMQVLGVSPFSARLPSAIFGFLTVLAMFVMLERTTGNRRFAATATAVLGLNLSYLVIARAATADMALNFFVLTATLALVTNIYAKQRGYMPIAIAGFLLALALLAKGPVALMVPGVVVLTAVLARGGVMYNLRCVNPLILLPAMALALMPWIHLVVEAKGMDFFREFLLVHNLERFTGGFGNTQSSSPFYYLVVLLVGFFPWVLLLPSAIVWVGRGFLKRIRSDRLEDALPALGLVWLGAVVVFFSFSATKLPHYILPALPGAALLIAGRIEALRERPLMRLNWLWVMPWVVVMGGLFIALKWAPDLAVGGGPAAMSAWLEAQATQFGWPWPLVQGGQDAAVLAQQVRMSIAPVLIGAMFIVFLPVGFAMLMQGSRGGMVTLAATMWVALTLLVIGVAPTVYQYLQQPLANFARDIRDTAREGDAVYFVALHQPSVRFISGRPFESVENAAQLKAAMHPTQRAFIVTKQDRKDAIVALLPKRDTFVECQGGFCLLTYEPGPYRTSW